jgi:hypothetical protein
MPRVSSSPRHPHPAAEPQRPNTIEIPPQRSLPDRSRLEGHFNKLHVSDASTRLALVMPASRIVRFLLRRLLLTVSLVLVLTAIAWSETDGGPRHLETAFVVGLGASALIIGCYWLTKRCARRTRRAFHQGYHEHLALKGDQQQAFGRRLAEAPRNALRPGYRDEVVRRSARGAGRFVGSVRQAYRDGREGENSR